MNNYYDKELVNKEFPEAIMVPAMKVWSLPKGKEGMLIDMCENGEYFGQIKKDGFWYEFNKTENNSYLFSRNESTTNGLLTEKLSNVPHIGKVLNVLPKDTIVIGEVYVPGGTSKNTTRIMGSLPQKAIERQEEEGLIHYYLHDVIMFNGVCLLNKGAAERYKVLLKIVETFSLLDNDFIELAIAYTDNLYERIGTALANGEEGMVLKKKGSIYSPGKKPAWSAIKCKKVDFADVVCMGFEDAKENYTGTELETWQFYKDSQGIKYNTFESAQVSECAIYPITKAHYYGWKNSIIIGAYNSKGVLEKIGTVSSGLTDSMKASITKEPEKYIGQVLFVQCMELDSEGKSLRHGIFKGFRIDKNAIECTIKDIFN
ncbi:hypothetical protein [Clostridium sp.]|uniref:ATP-dependent DNA ligase n=1 Tax=Clostridium sp. TaxID=1506 RepID=UPI002FCAF47A